MRLNRCTWSLLAGLFCLLAVEPAAAESPAHRALQNFRRGVNFGNYLEVAPGQSWSVTHTIEDVRNVKSEGFDHIRLPVGWHHYTGPAPEFKLSTEIFGKADQIVTNALAEGLAVLINIHHFEEFTTNPAAETNRLIAIWRQIAAHYKSAPNKLAFEILNEPKDAATTEIMNGVYAMAIAEIRKITPDKTLFVGPGRWNGIDEVPKLKLPEADRNLVVTVHCYDPFLFTHQGASWTGAQTATRGIVYPGPPKEPVRPDPRVKERWHLQWLEDYNKKPAAENPSSTRAFAARMQMVADWAKTNDRPIHLGEFGAYERADRESRARYYQDMRQTAERLGFGWAIWDWKAGFKYWDGGKAVEGMNEALFGK